MKCPKCQTDNPDTQKFCGECASPLPHSEDIQPSFTKTLETPVEELTRGTLFANRYEIIEELGKGGMGKVYRVEDTKTKEEIALKLIKPEIAVDEKTLERFRNELTTARKISHRNVCRMFDLGEERGTHYITMEYVSGGDLKRFIRRAKRLDTGTAISIAKQICEGLAEAHSLGVVHRDLKPNNIMIDDDGNVRIMDFGIARSLSTKGITGAGVMIGTPEYMSPEQAEAKEVDQRTDIYSLGIILYEMITGQLPFEGDTPLAVAMKHKGELPKNPKDLNPQIPEDLSRLILRCLEKDNEARFQIAGEVRSELSLIEKGMPTTEKEAPARKPLTSKEITVSLSVKRLFIPALLIVLIIVVGLVLWHPWSKEQAVHIQSDKPSLAVLYFKNNTGDENLNHWRSALSDLIIADLSQSKYVRVLSSDRLFKILNELNQLDAKSYASDVLSEIADQGGVTHLLQGTYAKAGDSIRINVMVQEAKTGEIIGSEGVEGKDQERIFFMVDELTKRIKANFQLSMEEIASDIDKDVGKITTHSPEAFKLYSDGIKYHNKGDYDQSILFMEKAIDIDPDFAMAYRSMAKSFGGLLYRARRAEALQKAMELTDRVSEREYYLIQGDYYLHSAIDYNKAIDAYKKLLELYPEDSTGNLALGVVYLDFEEWDKAIERLDVLFKLKDDAVHPYNSLAIAYMGKGLYNKAREVLEYYQNNISDIPSIHLSLALNYRCQGKFDLALAEVGKATSLDPDNDGYYSLRGIIYQGMGNLIEAESEFYKRLEAEEPIGHMWIRVNIGNLYLLQGKFKKARDQFSEGIEQARKLGEKGGESGFYLDLAYTNLKSGNPEEAFENSHRAEATSLERWGCKFCHQERALHLKGLALIDMNSMDEAQRTAEELKELVEERSNWKYMRAYHHLQGMGELRRNNFIEAVEHFQKAVSLLSFQTTTRASDHAFYIESLAFAYLKLGDLDKAQEEYERIISLTIGRESWGDIYAQSHFMLGKIYEEKGWKGKAIEHYQKFLSLWKDADPALPEIEDARKRLAGLE